MNIYYILHISIVLYVNLVNSTLNYSYKLLTIKDIYIVLMIIYQIILIKQRGEEFASKRVDIISNLQSCYESLLTLI